MNIRYPQITARSEAEQLAQVKSYLYQLVEQLNMTVGTMGGGSQSTSMVTRRSGSEALTDEEAKNTFNAIKGLIIKSADIVTAIYDKITYKLDGLYVAESDFGTYTEATGQLINANAKEIESLYSNIQAIVSDIEGIENSIIEVNAHIKSGLLYYDDSGAPVYGVEVGQETEIDGVVVFDKFAQFTSDRLAFFDANGNEVAYISDKKLYITHAEITGSLRLGGFVDTVLSDGGIVTKWVGTGG